MFFAGGSFSQSNSMGLVCFLQVAVYVRMVSAWLIIIALSQWPVVILGGSMYISFDEIIGGGGIEAMIFGGFAVLLYIVAFLYQKTVLG